MSNNGPGAKKAAQPPKAREEESNVYEVIEDSSLKQGTYVFKDGSRYGMI